MAVNLVALTQSQSTCIYSTIHTLERCPSSTMSIYFTVPCQVLVVVVIAVDLAHSNAWKAA